MYLTQANWFSKEEKYQFIRLNLGYNTGIRLSVRYNDVMPLLRIKK